MNFFNLFRKKKPAQQLEQSIYRLTWVPFPGGDPHTAETPSKEQFYHWQIIMERHHRNSVAGCWWRIEKIDGNVVVILKEGGKA